MTEKLAAGLGEGELHIFFRVLTKREKTIEDKALLSAVMLCSTQAGFSHLTPEQTFDKLAAEWDEILKESV